MDLRAPDDRVLSGVLAQPKRVALLVYLAAARPVGFHRRDRLIALFWPELDDARARDALSQALRFLRQALGADAVVTRGVDEVGLDRERVWCDAAAFRAAADDGGADEALRLYGGDFLDGFFAEEASGFEEWVETERASLRELAARGARQLAEQHDAEGAHTVAVAWGRRAAELAPDDERAFRRLLGLLDRAGDRAGTLQAYDDFARRLRAEYGAEPAAETRAMVEALRRASGMPAVVAVATPSDAPVLSPVVDRQPREVPSAPPAPLAVGASLAGGRYAIEGVLGIGGMATVYLAHDVRHERRVAVKVLRPEIAARVGAKALLREIRIAASLQHPHIVPLFDSGESDGHVFYVMPHIAGESLRVRLQREPVVPLDIAMRIARDVGDALAYAHRRGIVHRDIKPDNILLSGDPASEEFHALVADFGVAKALHATGSQSGADTLTLLGHVVGTPRYMAPEQAVGARVDSRTDVYAWAIVAYELLAGEHPFHGDEAPESATPRDVIGAPRPLSVRRPDAPPRLVELVMRCLEADPRMRKVDCAAVVAELDEVLRAEASLDPRVVVRTRRGDSGIRLQLVERWKELAPTARAVVTGLLATVLIAAFAARTLVDSRDAGSHRAPTRADTSIVALLPLELETASASASVDEARLHEAFSRYAGIMLVDRFRVADAASRRGRIRSVADATALASELGAGRYVRGHVRQHGDSWRVYLALYDVGTENALQQATEEFVDNPTSVMEAFSRLADSLLLRGTTSEYARDRVNGTRSLPALQAMSRGHGVLANWDLAAADSAFEAAVAFDPEYMSARVWLAQVRAWRGMPVETWSTLAERAHANSSQLTDKDRRLAEGLVSLAREEYASACATYDALRRRNDRDFAAWFGLGMCRTLDRTVIPDASSPTGWRFRSSYHRAVDAYSRAFELLPSIHRGYEGGAFEGVLNIFLLVRTEVVSGFAEDRQRTVFYGRPSWVETGDTLALIPYPQQAAFSGNRNATPIGFDAAHRYLQKRFATIAAGWSASFPRSAGAKQAVAIALELAGDPSAIDTMRLARELAADSLQKLRLAISETVLRVKFGAPADLAQLRAASLLRDSVLRHVPRTALEADLLAPLAALGGRCSLAEQLARRARQVGWPRSIPTDLVIDAQALLAAASLGCPVRPPTPTVSDLAAAIRRRESDMSPGMRRWADAALLFRPALLTEVPDTIVLERLIASTSHKLVHAARAAARRDTAAVRATLAEFRARWRVDRGPPTPDIVYPGASLLAAVGDYTAAIDWLDGTLTLARTYDPKILHDPARTATFVRSMALRADLAMATGDTAAASRWSAAVSALWSNPDPALQQLTRRMVSYASQR